MDIVLTCLIKAGVNEESFDMTTVTRSDYSGLISDDCPLINDEAGSSKISSF